jgi:glycine dehydrogenase subunit 2
MHELENWLKELSGLPGVTLNPAAGAHGEFAGILTIRRAHEAKGNPRKYILCPDSAHGTNPATAAACGYKVLTVATSKETGKVEIDSIKQMIAEHGEDIAGIMLTNPNTCGLFETDAKAIADLLHEIGAFFYCDGANFNAIVGKVKPSEFGVDVMHFNLHKTFSTPHGGGGPGSGPIAVCDALKLYLPTPFVIKKSDGSFTLKTEDDQSIGRLRAFQGQVGMYVRALTYMLSHGKDGLKQVAEDAVLNANYIRAHVKDLYRVPFDEYCMHEFLMNDRNQRDSGVTTMEIAKTMIEYGIHPMTVFFPLVVNAAMLVEPTETESKQSLDRLIAVFRKIALDVKSGNVQAIEQMKQNPVSAPRKKLDEVKAAKDLKLKFGD